MSKQLSIILRAPELPDADLIFEWENDRDIWYLSNTKLPISRFDIEQYVLSSDKDIYTAKQARFMIDVHKEEKKITAGCIDLFDFDPANRRAGVGILIDAACRKKGYASAALDQLVDYAFKILDLHQLYCNIAENNQASLQLFQRKGFSIIGLKEDWILNKGSWENEYLLQRINYK